LTKPIFENLKSNHYSSDRMQPTRFLDGASVYREIGYDMDQLKRQNAGYENTCAVRMSLALLKSGTGITGRLKIKEGPLKGRFVESGAKLLADQLVQRGVLGYPQILTADNVQAKIQGKRGVIFFWKMASYSGGHIDLVESTNAASVCSSACYFDSKEIWFWPLD